MQKYVLLGLLSLCTWEDIRQKKVTLIYILIFGIIGVWMHLFAPACSVYSMLWGMVPGAVMIMVSRFSRGSVGVGDGILLTVTGIYLGSPGNLELFLTGLLLAACWALFLLATGKKKGKETIPFIPFLLASYVVMIVRWQI